MTTTRTTTRKRTTTSTPATPAPTAQPTASHAAVARHYGVPEDLMADLACAACCAMGPTPCTAEDFLSRNARLAAGLMELQPRGLAELVLALQVVVAREQAVARVLHIHAKPATTPADDGAAVASTRAAALADALRNLQDARSKAAAPTAGGAA